jgi:DNA helicase-2/ATP-dependent DNA helicase PcrA
VISPEDLLAGLDERQREAATALAGPVCILAGAGTGKTRTITHRVAYGIATGVYSPNRVMALTFTSKAAGELRARLARLGAGAVAARTFHSAALSQLGYFWPHTVGAPAPAVLSGKSRMLAQVAHDLKLPVDTAVLRDVAAEIEWRKVSMLSIDEYAEHVDHRPLPPGVKPQALLEVMKAYEDRKDRLHRIDFEDVLLACAGMLEAEPAVALQVRTRYRFFVVDEFQDVSPLQEHLLGLWLGRRHDLCVVGDAAQAIYSFAGASSDFLTGFERRHPGARVIRLGDNYRSSAPIVAAANRLMQSQASSVTLHAVSSGEHEAALSLSAHPTDIEESAAIARAIGRRIAEGVAARDIAILYRVGAQAAVVESALQGAEIPYRILGQAGFFDQAVVREAVLSLRGASIAVAAEPLFKSVSDVLRSLGWSQNPPESQAARQRWELLDVLMRLAEEEPPGTGLRVFTDHLLERQAHRNDPVLPAVTLGTIHSAKGLEWDHVYLIGLSEGLMPIHHAVGPAALDEERRLLYVGLTRARRSVALSWAGGSGRQAGRTPSRFLAELRIRTVDDAGGRTSSDGRRPTM